MRKNNQDPKITIYDIAKELGLSPSTVGHALNGTGRISEATREKVTRAAAKMGYQPSLVAKSLSNNRTFTIGVVVPSISNAAYSAMVNGIEDVAYEAGYNIIICCSQFDQKREAKYLQMLRNRRVEGIVIIPTRRVESYKKQIESLLKIDDSGLPLVVLEQNINEENLTKVVMDNFNGARKITKHLISLGHRKIGFLHLGYEETDFAGNERFAGYKAALSEAGLEFSKELAAQAATITSIDDEQYKYDSFARYYESAGHPSAVFAVCDTLAIKIIRDCSLMGLRVPEDLAIAGFDNIQLAGIINPPLTTVQQPAIEMGRRAMDIVLGRIDGRIEYQVSEKVQGKLIVRESCGIRLRGRRNETADRIRAQLEGYIYMQNIDLAKESDYKRRVDGICSGTMLPGTNIEIIREPAGRGDYCYALFDFDGTLSLLREGWPEVMGPMMVEILLDTPNCEPEDQVKNCVSDLIARTTGKQTIYQMMDFCEEVRRRGGNPLEPSAYKSMYIDLLMARINNRLEGLRCGKIKPEEMLVVGSYALLDALRANGVQMYLASGTDEANVREEAELLGVTQYFGKHVYGAIEDYKNYSKAQVIQRIISESGVSGSKLLGFGDGYVELDNTKAAGGTAIGVASAEVVRTGKADEFKRERLIGVGADVIVPDFSEAGSLVNYLFEEDV